MNNLALPISRPPGHNRRILEKSPLPQRAIKQPQLPSPSQEKNRQKKGVRQSPVLLKQSPIQTNLPQKDPA